MTSENVIFSKEARDLCKQNTCGKYGTSWTCPPAVGSFEECKAKCLQYKQALLFSTVTSVKDAYDFEGWEKAQINHEKITESLAQIFKTHIEEHLILSTSKCLHCQSCTYPKAPCNHPDRMYPSVESYGVLVMEQAKLCNIHYINGENTVTYFSLIFF